VIFVTVGMHTDGFPRLIQEMDRIAALIDEEVVMQIGATAYHPTTARWFPFTTEAEMKMLCEQARVIVSHAGSGSILTALQYGKPLIVMPRLQKYAEHVDDHQLELAGALSQVGALLVASETADLWRHLRSIDSFSPKALTGNRSRLVTALRNIVLDLAEIRA
jgi:beta-1,4-N-acetylglucosaminyltransferase